MISYNNFISTTDSIGVSDPPCVPVQLEGDTFTGLSEIVDPPSCIAAGGGILRRLCLRLQWSSRLQWSGPR